MDSIRGIHDATMLMCMFGWVPPMRVSMLITLLKPYLQHQCLQPNCSCQGNFLYYQSASQQQLGVSWHHHKTARKQGGVAISYGMPQDLNTMFSILLTPYNRNLLESKGQTVRTVFVTNTGRELNMGTWGHYFDRLCTKLGERYTPGSNFSQVLPSQQGLLHRPAFLTCSPCACHSMVI